MVYTPGFSSRPPPTRSYERTSPSPGREWGAVDWGISPDRLEERRGAFAQERKPGLWNRITKLMTGALATVALTVGFYEGRALAEPYTPPPQQTVHEHVLSDDEARMYRAGVDGPNSLWRIAEDYLADSLPPDQPARDQMLLKATDMLAEENGFCPPSVWHAQHPGAAYSHALECDDGRPSPHVLEKGEEVRVASLDAYRSDSPEDSAFDVNDVEVSDLPSLHERSSDPSLEERATPIPQTHVPDSNHQLYHYAFGPDGSVPPLKGLPEYEPTPAGPEDDAPVPPSEGESQRSASTLEWIVAGLSAGVLATAGAVGGYLARRQGHAHRQDRALSDPQRALKNTPHGNATLAFGHAYLARKDYSDRTSETPTQGRRLSGVALMGMERKAARLNRLAAMLDTPYVSGSDTRAIGDHVREALGLEDLTDRTARSYVEELAELGHANAQAYLGQMPTGDPEEESESEDDASVPWHIGPVPTG